MNYSKVTNYMKVHIKVLLHRVLLFVVACVAVTSLSAYSATPSKAQLDAFKQLPKAQQKAFARQYGIDLSVLNGMGKSQRNNQNDNYNDAQVLPRDDYRDRDDEDSFDPDKRYAPKVKELKRFGLDLFAGEPTTFEPLNNVPVPVDYQMGAGDVILVNLYGNTNETHEVTVNREGQVLIPQLAPLTVVGMRFSDMKQAIVAQVKSGMIGVEVSVSMASLRSIRIFVLGESYKPGAYAISSLSTITHALIASGGVSDIGSLRNIQLKRGGKLINKLDLYDLLIRGDNTNDVVLHSGDVVFIPTSGDLVSVSGQVRREAIFEMKANETFADLVKMAGGFPSTAYPNNTLIERFNGGSLRTLVNLDLSQRAKLALSPVNGDKVNIPAVSSQYKDAISLIGAVVRPGRLQWRNGMRVSDVIRSVDGDLLAISDLNYALVVRQNNSKGNISVHQFSLIAAIEGSRAEDNLLLNARDKIVIFSRYETIEAENRRLDKYAYTESEINERQQTRLWGQYQQQQFMDYVGIDKVGKTKEELNKLEFDSANQSLMAITNQHAVNKIAEKDYALFSRRRLLAPIILKLREQATVDMSVQLVEVDGRVKYAGVYPLPVNGLVSHLITAAGGLLESAFLERAEITRLNSQQSETTIEHLSTTLDSALKNAHGAANISLKSKDRLNVLAIPNWQENITVTLTGEVTFPGKYTIRRGEVLSSVVNRAGGFTEFSAPKGAVFSRMSLRRKEVLQLNKLSEDLKRNIAAKSFQSNNTNTGVVSYAETKQLLEDLSKVRAVGRLVVDLNKVMNKEADVRLEDGDVLHIPPVIQSINVIGEVNVATAHMFDKDISVKDYITKSGGFKQRADEERIYIIKADGSVVIPETNQWFAVEYKVPLETGDTIVVPLDAEHMDNLTLWSTATQILYQLGVAVAAIGSL
ncbi:MAG: polysaccharide export outer membrane protein [Alteromonadaceae bacterium]|jgi:polysaccharide export outer membrane protein